MKTVKTLRYLVLGLFVSYTVSLCKAYYDWSNCTFTERANQSFNWCQAPPPGCDTVKLMGLLYYWNSPENRGSFGNFKLTAKEIPVVFDADSVYLEMIIFDTKNFCESLADSVPRGHTSEVEAHGWIKTVREGNSLRFPNNKVICNAEYDLLAWPFIEDNVMIFGYKDTLYINSVELGKDTIVTHYFMDEGSWHTRQWDVEYLDDGMMCDYDPVSGLISNPDAELLIASDRREIITDMDSPLEMAVKNFFIGHMAEEPDYLPAPSVRYKWEDKYVYCDTYLDVMTEDGRILNCNNIYTDYYIKRKEYGNKVVTLKSTDGFNPFRNDAFVNYLGKFTSLDELEVMCYYNKADGTRVESPRVKAFDVTGINDIQAEPKQSPTPDNDYVYDLTGRRVNPQNLSPGIYIRNGRKFTVTRN